MPDRQPLPHALARAPFNVRAALDSGVTRKRLRSSDLSAPFWGTRIAFAGELALRQKCLALQARLPSDAVFSHATAGLLLGAPLPPRHEHEPRLHVSVPAPQRAMSPRGVIGHKLQLSDGDRMLQRGLRTTAPARTWCDLASVLTLHDLVAVGDFLIHWRLPIATIEELAAAVERYPGRRGRRLLRQALGLLSDRAESHPESVLRVILVLGGLPVPEINRDIVEANGTVFARLDLRYRREKVAIEYQGDYHRENKGQWRKDMSRRRRLEADGWFVIEINADDLCNPEELVRSIRSVLIKRGAALA